MFEQKCRVLLYLKKTGMRRLNAYNDLYQAFWTPLLLAYYLISLDPRVNSRSKVPPSITKSLQKEAVIVKMQRCSNLEHRASENCWVKKSTIMFQLLFFNLFGEAWKKNHFFHDPSIYSSFIFLFLILQTGLCLSITCSYIIERL